RAIPVASGDSGRLRRLPARLQLISYLKGGLSVYSEPRWGFRSTSTRKNTPHLWASDEYRTLNHACIHDQDDFSPARGPSAGKWSPIPTTRVALAMGSTQVAQIVTASLAASDDMIGSRRTWLATDPASRTITLEHQRCALLHVMSPASTHQRSRCRVITP